MCGIAGGPEGSRTRKALDAIAHRGPDAAGVHVASGYEQGHVRLSIIDVSASSDQPFKYSDGVLCFNGEIWNFKALREELVGLGHEFRTSGDTEVLAAALAEWGPKAALLRRPKSPFQEGAQLRETAVKAVADPARFYKAEHNRHTGSKP